MIARAREVGVQRMVTIGSSAAELTAVAPLLDEPGIYTTAGLHPNHADEWDDALEAQIRERATHPRCVAIGETGLDWFRDHVDRATQTDVFRRQLALARELDMTVSIHCRNADEECFPLLVDEGPERVILHCFAVPERLDEAIANGWWCSFAGNVTYPANAALREAAAAVPDDLLLVETDAPYLTPQPMRRERNRPAFVVETAKVVAEVRGTDPETLDRLVTANAERVFGW